MLTEAILSPGFETKSADHCAPEQASRPETRGRRYRPRRTTSDRVIEALIKLGEGRASVLSHQEKAWASITFSGTRHEVMLDFDGHDAVEVGEEFITALPDHEFRIPGQLVAEATVREVDHRFTEGDERMVVTCVLLLLDES